VCVWTQDFKLARQALYSLSHVSSPPCSGYFGDGFSPTICLGWPRTGILRHRFLSPNRFLKYTIDAQLKILNAHVIRKKGKILHCTSFQGATMMKIIKKITCLQHLWLMIRAVLAEHYPDLWIASSSFLTFSQSCSVILIFCAIFLEPNTVLKNYLKIHILCIQIRKYSYTVVQVITRESTGIFT
jgi:hypothetical protein